MSDAQKASVPRDPRGPNDGKDAKLGYGSDSTNQIISAPAGESSGDFDLRTSKWREKGDRT